MDQKTGMNDLDKREYLLPNGHQLSIFQFETQNRQMDTTRVFTVFTVT
jgi:hypothetical protein